MIRGFEKVSYAPEDVVLPCKKTKGSACYDIYLAQDVEVCPGECTKNIPTFVKAYMPENEVLLVFIRSSVGVKRNVALVNSVGVIDNDYYNNPDNEGNVGIALHNFGREKQTFRKGDRIAQAMFVKFGVADNDNVTDVRKGGIGSTGL